MNSSPSVAQAYTVPRLRRLLQMEAAIGWLQRNSSRSKEGGVSCQGRRGTRAGLWRVGFSPKISVAAACGGAVALRGWRGRLCFSSGCWVHDGFQMVSGLSDAPTVRARCRCQAATEHRINNAPLVLHPHLDERIELMKRKTKRTQTQGTI